MKFKRLKRDVDHAEQLVAECSEQTLAGVRRLRTAWSEGWTPWRIVLAGVAAGFIAGRVEPMTIINKFAGIRWTQIINTASMLFSGFRAAAQRDHRDNVEEPPAADTAPVPRDPSSGPQAPHPAEAATEISEN
ncbi:MAG: hypothetical protein LBV45_06745 [Xanthomonadaceae bacterium]|jgi:hypothetical protein|nr:hypothetical protein [Xanthomonadaceae bacterium]